MKKKSIIIIDDHALLRNAWSIILESTGRYTIVGKFSKKDPLEDIIRNNKPDVALLDVSFRQLYDFPIIKLIRKFSPLTKIVAISLQLEKIYEKKLLLAGAKGFLHRDCPAEELIEAVEAVLKGRIYLCEDFNQQTAKKGTKHNSERISGLTKREIQIIHLVRQGLSSREIASKIAIAPKTVDTHRRKILKKLNLKNSTALIQLAHTYGL